MIQIHSNILNSDEESLTEQASAVGIFLFLSFLMNLAKKRKISPPSPLPNAPEQLPTSIFQLAELPIEDCLEFIARLKDGEFDDKYDSDFYQIALALEETYLEKDEMLQEKDEVIKQLKGDLDQKTILHDLRSGTISARFNALKKHSQIRPSMFPWSPADRTQVNAAWSALRSNTAIRKIDRSKKERDVIHPALKIVFKRILGNLKLQSKVKFQHECRLEDPLLIPDFVGGPALSSQFGWSESYVAVASKIKWEDYKQGAADAAEYLSHIVEKISETEFFRDRVGVFTDFSTVEFFYCEDGDLAKMTRSRRFELFPPAWWKKKRPTVGFRLLCDAISVPMPKHLPQVTIDGIQWTIDRTLFDSNEIAVYALKKIDGSQFAVKVAKSRQSCSAGLLKSEWRKIQDFYSMEAFKEYMLAPMPEFDVDRGFAMELGSSFMADYQQRFEEAAETNADTTEITWDILKPHACRILQAIELLNAKGFMHGDIRPRNLIMLDGKVRLIDWVTAVKFEEWPHSLRQGYEDPFWPDSIQAGDAQLWDLYCLGYTFLYMAVSKAERQAFANAEKRADLVAEYSSKTIRSIACACARLITHLNGLAVASANNTKLKADDFVQFRRLFSNE